MTAPQQQSALVMLQALLKQWGLESLSGAVSDMLTSGDGADVIPIKLRDTEAYKTRFKGNLERVKNGLPALSEAEFLQTETALKAVVRRYVGSGQYDTKENLDRWIAGDLSPSELNDRMGIYQKRFLQQPVEVREAWAANGLTPGDAIKAMMDPKVDETTLKRSADIYGLGAAAFQAYKDPAALNRDRLGELVDRGVNVDTAGDKLQQVAGRQDYEGFLARTQGTDLSRTEQEDAALLGDSTAEQKRRKVLSTEQAKFAENYLGTGTTLARGKDGTY